MTGHGAGEAEAPVLTTDLYEQVLMRYVRMGADELHIVSAYSTPEMCTQLIADAVEIGRAVRINLIIGMVGIDGIDEESHNAFLRIRQSATGSPGDLLVRYGRRDLGVHSKVFVWSRDREPFEAWVGSANFTQAGFGVWGNGARRMEVMTPIDALDGLIYYNDIFQESVDLEDESVLVTTGRRNEVSRVMSSGDRFGEPPIEKVILPLVALQSDARTGTVRGGVHVRSGLNWGQRAEYNRDPNQAYIPVPSLVQRSDFFPPRRVVFRVVTDDDDVLLMARAQDNGKALHTPLDNGTLGRYFRRRLGVPSGAPVRTEDLIEYGSRFVEFYKRPSTDGEPIYGMSFAPEVEVDGVRVYGA